MKKTNLEIRDELNAISPSFCLAKWLQVTIHLQNGQTHSCHHPGTHKVPLEELKVDSSALHNTKLKKSYREMMLKGERPQECAYCWRIEDAHKDNLSDRTFKSADPWAYPKLQEIASKPWVESVNPQYIEVSFGSECNFKCAYCAPHISSGIMSEYLKFGHYKSMSTFSLDNLKREGKYPYSKDDYNPYVEAFWDWWPSLSKDLKVFRITGGEPLLNPNTYRFLEGLKKNPMPELSLAINSNLGIPKATYRKFLDEIKYILENKLIKSFQFYTSVDTYGKNAEFIRFGLNYEEYMENVRMFLKETKDVQLVFMSTYNAFSVVNFRKFLEQVTELKKEFKDQNNHPRVMLDTPYLNDPNFLSCAVLTNDFWKYVRSDLAYMKESAKPDPETGVWIWYEHEIRKFERILTLLESLEENEYRRNLRRALYDYLNEYQFRKGISFEAYCPEYMDFYRLCELTMLED
jgi:organic radical activating enzyme